MKKLVMVFALAGLAAGGTWFFIVRSGTARSAEVKFRTAKVERGQVIEGVAASGTIQPTVLVQVGTQVSGVIEKLFKDFNSPVKAGETIALLDARRLNAQLLQDEASLVRARAEVTRVKAELARAERELVRQKTLAERRLTSYAELDAAVAGVDVLKAQIEVAEAAVRQTQASIEIDRVNLGYATIVSPIDGVVVSRNVDVGQTVASSLSAPTLFVIANDLTKVQVQASVPEADIGRIRVGQVARFGVDAHPERRFEGEVSQVRLASTVNQNVVTYTVLIDAENPDGYLLPGMTANVTFEIATSPADGLRVPSAALRFRPPEGVVEAAAAAGPPQRERGAKIYVPMPNGRLRAIAVRRGVSDGAATHVIPIGAATLDEGAEIVTAILAEGADEPPLTNPFAPPRMGGGPGAGGRRGGGGGGR